VAEVAQAPLVVGRVEAGSGRAVVA